MLTVDYIYLSTIVPFEVLLILVMLGLGLSRGFEKLVEDVKIMIESQLYDSKLSSLCNLPQFQCWELPRLTLINDAHQHHSSTLIPLISFKSAM